MFDIALGPGDRAFESYYSAPLKSMISEGPFSSLIPAVNMPAENYTLTVSRPTP